MTLLKQIYSLLFTLFILLMSSLIYFQFTETKTFLVEQMENDLNNTVTSLSLRLKPHLEEQDEATVNTLINVIVEGGYYKKVKITWLNTQQDKTWENSDAVTGVPAWFLKLNLFEKQSKEVTITSGWLQLATLEIESNFASGYRELWMIMKNTVIILSAIFLFSFIVVYIRLQRILKPLYEVAQHAHDVSHRKFHPELRLPSTVELKEVVNAINSMSRQLKHVFKALDEEVESHKQDNLSDRVSQLPNRLFLAGQLNSWLSEPDFGALLLADFNWLNEIHSKLGYQMRDQTIKDLAKKFTTELESTSEIIIARISNTEFAFVLSKADKQKVSKYLQSLIRLINQEIINAGAEPNQNFAIGIAQRTEGVTRPELMSQADNALQKALNEHKTCHWFYVKDENVFSREVWRSKLVEAIEQSHFVFQWQPVQQCQSEQVIHHEVYCRLEVDGNIMQAGQFMPYIEKFTLGYQLDKCLLNAINNDDLYSINEEPIAVNLSRKSITDPNFHRWLTAYLATALHPEKIHFEISESGVTQNLAACIVLCDIIEKAGAKFGVDNCGRQVGSLAYLQELKPHYLKIDMSLACYDHEKDEINQTNLQICRTLVKIARGLDISVICTGIENEKFLQAITPLRANGYQGYIMPPVDLVK